MTFALQAQAINRIPTPLTKLHVSVETWWMRAAAAQRGKRGKVLYIAAGFGYQSCNWRLCRSAYENTTLGKPRLLATCREKKKRYQESIFSFGTLRHRLRMLLWDCIHTFTDAKLQGIAQSPYGSLTQSDNTNGQWLSLEAKCRKHTDAWCCLG